MKQYFSEKIKTLRRNADLTQEKLAEYLGVAAQTVSKWERAEAYPDIDLLPMIANYFHITIDELLGHDLMRADLEIDQLIAQSRELARLGHEEEAIALSLSGYQKYPYSHKMMARYAKDLLLYSEGEAWKKALPVAEKIAETILEDSSDENLRYDALDMLGSTYFGTPKYEALCERIPEGFTFTREMWIAEGHPIDTDQGLALRQKNMLELMHLFFSQVDTLCGIRCNPQPKKLPDADTSIAVRKMKLNILQCRI